MTIDVHFNSATVFELQDEMRQLLNGEGRPTGPITGGQIASGGAAGSTEPAAPKKQTAAEKKAAEKAAAEAVTTTTGQGISTGAERTDPATDAQDAKDEAADTAAAKIANTLTHDDVKKLLGGYVMAYGMEAAQADGTGFIGAPKISEIPNTQAALAAAVIGIAKGINGNPHKRELNGDGLSAEKTAELKVIVTAAMAVK